jgi:hypothetical protein
MTARTVPSRTLWTVLGAVAAAGLLAGCAAGGAAPAEPAAPAPAVTVPLATSMTTATGQAWAIVAMGGSAADENRFWELFTRLPGGSQWKLDTPPGVADNGGLAAADSGGALTVAFEPNQDLVFSPLAQTANSGKTWDAGLLNASVATVPDALAADSTAMLALLHNGAIDQSTTGQAASGNWAQLAAPGTIAASTAGRACQVTGLTAVAYTPSGTPLAAASCARQGIAGIFAHVAGTWRATGPTVPGGQTVKVVQLTQTQDDDTALLQATAKSGASLLASWTGDGTRWTVSPSLPLRGSRVLASGTGPGGAVWVLLSGGRAEILAAPGAAWQELPAPPPGTAALAAGSGGTDDALAVSGGTLTVYQLTRDGAAWTKSQAIQVPVQYGSSS